MKLEVGSLSDVGRTRDHNEDYLGMYRPTDAAQRRRKGELFLVADGIGGHQSGEVASQMAVEHIIQAYSNGPGENIVAELVQAIEAANATIYAKGQGQDRRWRMGTTLVGALVRDHDLHVVNVGDSRAYLLRGTQMEQVSQDHSLIAEQVRMGLIDAGQVKDQDYRSAITRALGSKPEVKVDTFDRTLQGGDIIVLCTDGLSGLLKDEEIARVVIAQSPAHAVTALVAQANARGGRDNITTLVIKAHQEGKAAAPARSQPPPAKRSRLGAWWVVGILALGAAILTVGLLAILLLLGAQNTNDLPAILPAIRPFLSPAPETPPAAREDFARTLGYENLPELLVKEKLLPHPPWGPLMPKQIYVLLTGRVVAVEAGFPPCPFSLDVNGEPYYTVACPQGVELLSLPNPRLAKGDRVSVLGSLPDQNSRQVEPVTIDISKMGWWGRTSEWQNWYSGLGAAPRRLLVYTVVSQYTVRIEKPGVQDGDLVAVYGPWAVVDGKYVDLTVEKIFVLDGEVYKQVMLK